MMEYHVASGSSPYLLAKEVKDLIRDGWKPLGGVSVSSGNMVATPLFCQAMTRGMRS